MFEGSFGAVLVNHVVAGRVDTGHVVPPFISSCMVNIPIIIGYSVLIAFLSLKSVPETLLSEVLVNDFVPGNLVV